MLGHGFQSDIRERNSFVQKLLLQCDPQHTQDLAADYHWYHISLRMYQISHETFHITTTSDVDGVSLLSVDLLALLCVVGLRELPERWWVSDQCHNSKIPSIYSKNSTFYRVKLILDLFSVNHRFLLAKNQIQFRFILFFSRLLFSVVSSDVFYGRFSFTSFCFSFRNQILHPFPFTVDWAVFYHICSSSCQ